MWWGSVIKSGLLACFVGSCGSTGVIPKAYDNGALPIAASDAPATDPARDPEAGLVVVAPDVAAGWQFLYRFITETEFVLCLEGSQQNGQVIIDGFRLARMEASSVNSVRYQPCDGARYIGTAHNHPPVDAEGRSLCYQSEPDRRSFGMDQRAVVDVVLCGGDTFRWWLKNGATAARTLDQQRGP